MGTLTYAGAEYTIDERVLAHLKIAITAKLRLGEGFLLSWQIPTAQGSGRVSLWISPQIPIIYRFSGSRVPELNKNWIDALTRSAHGIRGMVVMDEAQAVEYVARAGSPTAP